MGATSEHWRIEKWAHEHGAVPAQVRRLKFDGQPATLTFLFGSPEGTEPDIHPITWESFFAQFDLLKLTMSFEEESPFFEILKTRRSPGAASGN